MLLFENFSIIIKKKNYQTNIYFFCMLSINMINQSLNELKLVARNRNIRDYENKSEKDLIKALSKPKPKIKIDKKKLEEIRKDFNKLMHTFSKKEIDRYRKAFYEIKDYRYLFTSEIKAARKNLNKFKKILSLKGFMVMLMVLIMMILIIMMMMILLMMMKTEKLEALEDYYKPIKTDDSFGVRNNNYIEYTSREYIYKNLSP